MAIKTEKEILEEYVNSLTYERIKKDIVLKDLNRKLLEITDEKQKEEHEKMQLQLNNEISFLQNLILIATDEYNSKQETETIEK